VRVERVALEHHRDVAIARRHVVDDPVADAERALGDLLEACDHPQGGRLAAPGRAYENHELAVLDLQGHVVHGSGAVGVDLAHPVERDVGHALLPPPRQRS
jgi:hypothetical protein